MPVSLCIYVAYLSTLFHCQHSHAYIYMYNCSQCWCSLPSHGKGRGTEGGRSLWDRVRLTLFKKNVLEQFCFLNLIGCAAFETVAMKNGKIKILSEPFKLLLTIFKAFVSLFVLVYSRRRALSTCEEFCFFLSDAFHTRKTGFTFTHICSVITVLATETRWTKTSHNLDEYIQKNTFFYV